MSKEIQISNYKDSNLVAQRNDFIRQAVWNINMNPLKILKLLISCIDVVDPPDDMAVYIKKSELFDFIGAKGKGAYRLLRDYLQTLQHTTLQVGTPEGDYDEVVVMTRFSWTKKSDYVRCEFYKDVWPFLTSLNAENPYLQYNIMNIKEMKSKFTIILYEYLLSHTMETGSKTITTSVGDLRRLTNTTEKYRDFKDFEKNVLKVAKKEINENNLEFFLFYEKRKDWRDVVEIEFRLRTRTSINDTEDYIEFPERLKNKITTVKK